MRSTSSDPVVLRDAAETSRAVTVANPELRSGTWTRLGGAAALGDAVTESVLGTLADRSRAAGRAQGYAAGWAEGRRRAKEEAERAAADRDRDARATQEESRVAQRTVLAALESAVARCGTDLADRSAELAAQAVDLALEIAAAVLQRELAALDDAGADAVRRALTTAPPTVAGTVRLHPDDLDGLDRQLVSGARDLTFVGDPSVSRGDARVETETQVVDASSAAALARVREVLGR